MTIYNVTDNQDREAMRIARPVIDALASRLAEVSSLEDEKGQMLAAMRVMVVALKCARDLAIQDGYQRLEDTIGVALNAAEDWVTVDEPAPAQVA